MPFVPLGWGVHDSGTAACAALLPPTKANSSTIAPRAVRIFCTMRSIARSLPVLVRYTQKRLSRSSDRVQPALRSVKAQRNGGGIVLGCRRRERMVEKGTLPDAY